MKTLNKSKLSLALSVALLGASASSVAQADSITDALTSGKASVDMRLRYETNDQDNALEDASALTLRTRIGYTTGSVDGFSATIEMEDNRIVLGQGEYSVPPAGVNTGVYSVIADPEFTELDQGFIQFKSGGFVAKAGRQVITFDGHRHVGHVGWRQDRQTFDAVSAQYSDGKDFTVKYAYVTQRNRIFGEAADLDSKDHMLNASYKTSVGTIVGYSYLLEVDNDTDNALDTYGVSFKGGTTLSDVKVSYAAEYATQSNESAAADFDTDYLMLEVGATFSGITAKLGQETLGSDDGAKGFATPLATLHKFNGWADLFLATPNEGLVDTYISLGGKALKGSWTVVYHDFEADVASATVDDLGSEVDFLFATKFSKNYSAGLKYAAYSGDGGKPDTDKLWVWVGAKF